MKLADALRYSWDRRAVHPAKGDGHPIEGSDFGVTQIVEARGFLQFREITKTWVDLVPKLRKKLLQSPLWEPVDPKPAMLVLAEAFALDWSDPDSSEDEPPPDEG